MSKDGLNGASSKYASKARAIAQAKADHDNAMVQTSADFSNAIAAAHTALNASLSGPVTSAASAAMAASGVLATDSKGNVNVLGSALESGASTASSSYSTSRRMHDVEAAQAYKTYLVALAGLEEGR